MFDFLNEEEKKNKSLKNLQRFIEKDVRKAKEKELLVGIDPETLLGSEIFRLSREILFLRREIDEMKNMVAKLVDHQFK